MNKKTLVSIQIAVWSCIIIFLLSVFIFALYREFNHEEIASFTSGSTIEYSESVSDIKDITVRLVSEDIQFVTSEGKELKIVQNASYNLKESDKLEVNRTGNNISIQKPNVNHVFNMFSSFNRRESIVIYIPLEYENEVRVKTVSGTICLDGINLSQIECGSTSGDIEMNLMDIENEVILETVSGDIKLDEVKSNKIDINTTSGGIKLRDNKVKFIDASTTSGDVKFQGLGNYFKINTTSGKVEIELEEMFEEITSSSVSGDIRIKIPENDGFKLKYSTISGDLKSDFNLDAGEYKTGSSKITLRTTSGDIDIEKK